MILHTASRLYRHAFSSIWFNRRVLILWHGKRERERDRKIQIVCQIIGQIIGRIVRTFVRSFARLLTHSRVHIEFSPHEDRRRK